MSLPAPKPADSTARRRPGQAGKTRLAAACALAISVAGCAAAPDHRAETAPPATVERVDLDRYAGKWFEIARYPNAFEDKTAYRCVGVTAEYARRPDGRVTVTNRCRKDTLDGAEVVAQGVARVVHPTNARLRVRFAPAYIPFAEGDYWILDLTDDYGAALVGDPDGRFLWVLARTPQLDAAVYARLLATAEAKGYATAPLALIPQPPAGR